MTIDPKRIRELLKNPEEITEEDKARLRHLIRSYEALKAPRRPFMTEVSLSPYMESLLRLSGVMYESRKDKHGTPRAKVVPPRNARSKGSDL